MGPGGKSESIRHNIDTRPRDWMLCVAKLLERPSVDNMRGQKEDQGIVSLKSPRLGGGTSKGHEEIRTSCCLLVFPIV